MGIINAVVHFQLRSAEISVVCTDVKCFESENVSFLVVVICCRHSKKKRVPWPPNSIADSEKTVDGCRLNGFLVILQIGPFFRLQIVRQVMFHSFPIENDFWTSQAKLCDDHFAVGSRSISENDIRVIFKSHDDFRFDVGVKIVFESGKITVQIQRN